MISKDRNFSSYNYYSRQRFLHGQILFHLDNPDPNPAERKTISNLNAKKSKYPAGMDSKIRILYTTGAGTVQCLFVWGCIMTQQKCNFTWPYQF